MNITKRKSIFAQVENFKKDYKINILRQWLHICYFSISYYTAFLSSSLHSIQKRFYYCIHQAIQKLSFIFPKYSLKRMTTSMRLLLALSLCVLTFTTNLYAHNTTTQVAESNKKFILHHTKNGADFEESFDFIIDSLIKVNWLLRFVKEQDLSTITIESDKGLTDNTIEDTNQTIDSHTQNINHESIPNIANLKYLDVEELKETKNIMLQSLPVHIINNKKPIVFNAANNVTEYKKQEIVFNESNILHNDFLAMRTNLIMQDLNAQKIFFTTIDLLRKQLDFFSEQTKAKDILNPAIIKLKELPNKFDIAQSLPNKQQKILKEQENRYLNTLASYIEILSYLELKSVELVPQNTIWNLTVQWILDEVASIIPINYSNLIVAKIIVSILLFLILWVWRKLIAKVIMYFMDFIVHISKQDKNLHTQIQKQILKPISLWLLAWSINVSIEILYYPTLEPERIANWFSIFYVINIAWLFIVIVKSYGVALIDSIAQKSNDGFRREIINLILKIFYSIIIIITILIILKKLGFNVSAIIASLGLGGLAVALAIKDILANFFASVMLLLDDSFSQGDWITSGNIEGSIVEIGLRRTTIRTVDNALLFVPNYELTGKAIKNWNRRKEGRRIKISVGVTYDATPEKLQLCVNKITEMLKNHPEIATETNRSAILDEADHRLALRQNIISIDDFLGYKNSMYVCVESLADSSINILIDCFSKSVGKADFLRVQENIIFKIMDIVKECELSFAFPSQSVYVENLPPFKNV
ncbi:hypothetical protein CQA53_05850 [Helicobacter didelphidarum]|uniref:Mechanosensitive ion channel family protein n=1 Tax=Helicobacter didelphidarum TaxID=2040648 RepID=A0A3D8ILJ3_9HELI|nr:mechanosensitive ion channel family protein [Helicobacter didelphidarum]RDU65815.1 hypothetical protein CQA53_05850 [Helicobacter didelphidarum]